MPKEQKRTKTIWTIGHSTRELNDFISMLESFDIEMVADVRSFPGSRKFPWFNKENLEITLTENKIEYTHLKKLGGRRKVNPESKHTVWRNEAFRGYADYMDSQDFEDGLSELEKLGLEKRTAYMCSEAVWWRCHRSMISDVLKVRSWTVMHIMDLEKATEHPFTKPAEVENGKLQYGA